MMEDRLHRQILTKDEVENSSYKYFCSGNFGKVGYLVKNGVRFYCITEVSDVGRNKLVYKFKMDAETKYLLDRYAFYKRLEMDDVLELDNEDREVISQITKQCREYWLN